MRYLEALRIVREAQVEAPLPFRLAMSGTPDPLTVYLRAAAAERGFQAEPQYLPFNTLRQFLLEGSDRGPPRRFILLPWDLVPELDWRSGVPERIPGEREWRASASEFLEVLGEEASAAFYLPAALPPVHHDPAATRGLARTLTELLRASGAAVWPSDWFSLSDHLSSGTPVRSVHLGDVAGEVVASLVPDTETPRKVLVTDLDGVLWHGVIGEDGPEGIECAPEGRGYRHFLFQTYLRKLRIDGILLAAVSRNDPDLVRAGFESEHMLLGEDEFVASIASYNAKSAQIEQLARSLNLGTDSFVFVDDNPVELAEVGEALPEVCCVAFPQRDEALPAFFETLAALFARRQVTPEDRERTAMYRRRLAGMPPSESRGADLSRFLRGLEMKLAVRDRTTGNRERAVQLINKTNQFNLNGIRRTDEEIGGILEEGGRLYTASLSDRTGSHGEILACLTDCDGRIRSFVMSCRVFQRRVEERFLSWLVEHRGGTLGPFEFHATPRNEPIRRFLARLAAAELPEGRGDLHLSDEALERLAGDSVELFELIDDD